MTRPRSTATTASASPRFDSLEQEVFLNLWRTYDRLKAIEEEVFGRVGLSAQQYNALRLLRAVHPESMRTLVLGGRLISRAPDVTRLLDRLEQRSLLVRERRAENRRVVEVRISAMPCATAIGGSSATCHRRTSSGSPGCSAKPGGRTKMATIPPSSTGDGVPTPVPAGYPSNLKYS